ncbi:MAG TPA: LPS assembly protein LptD [Thermoanaerobaculia bacterium]|nr:LPS assembly protein LptD [Thermoanaerobaculia bacterium]
MKPALRPLLIAALLVFTIAASAAAQASRFRIVPGPKPGGGELKWSVGEGGRVEGEASEYLILEGDVKIDYQDIKLQAQKVTYNGRTKDVVAEGNVIIDQGPTRVSANQAIYNLDSKTGTFFNATATMDPAMYFSGDRIEKLDEDTYRMTNGVFTSCELDSPAWSFRVGQADITVDDYAHMRNTSFRARRMPLLWLPRLVWPTKSDRSRGLLIPRITFGSSRFGQRLELGYFVPFGQSADATVTAELNSQGFFGAGLNFRYLPSENVKLGELDAYAVRDAEPELRGDFPGDIGPSSHWRYRYRHSQENLPGGFRGVVDIEDFSDLDFFREFDRDQRLHTLSTVYSSAYLTKNRPRYSLNILADRREILFPFIEQRFEQVPAVQLRMYPQRIRATPLYFSLESSAAGLRTGGTPGIATTANYQRADFFPTVSMQLRTPAWFSIRPQISARQTYYTSSLDRDPLTGRPVALDESVSRFYAQGQVEMVGPSVSRTFNRAAGGFSRFKHVIEPRFRYIYTSSNVSDKQDRIIRFDSVDTPFLPIVRDSVEYSLTQRLIGKESAGSRSAREVLSLSLRQTVSLSKPFTTATGSGSFPLNEGKFTPLTATLRVNPYQSITLDANATFGNITKQLDQSSFSANLIGTGKNADKYVGVTWFATYRDPRTNRGESSQFRINTGSHIIRNKLRADIQVNYDAQRGKFLEERYVLGWTGSCYGIAVAPRRFLIYDAGREESEWGFDFGLTLKNIGTVGQLR